jgi:hypothetical protein
MTNIFMNKQNTNNNKQHEKLKSSLVKNLNAFKKLGLSLVLINYLSIFPICAENKIELVNIYLSDSGSLILETKDKKQINNFEILKLDSDIYNLVLNDVTANKKLIEDFNFSHNDFQLKNNSRKESFFQRKNSLTINIKCTDSCKAKFEPLLGGLAYKVDRENLARQEILTETIEKPAVISIDLPSVLDNKNLDIEIAAEDFALPKTTKSEKEIHLLQANKKDDYIFTLTKEESPIEEFLDDLDERVVQQIFEEKDFRKKNIAIADSASLSHIGNKLKEVGHLDLSANAYAKALEVDPKNLNAMLGLARTTTNDQEKLHLYLKAIDDEALISIGKKWFQAGIAAGDEKQIAQAMISYQFAVLKNPQNPYYRFEYGQALEKSGYANFDQASKRYLEAAVLAKKDFKAGDALKEDILRKSTECLIKVLTKKGSPEEAVHYCDSYLSLGFKKFLDGRSIEGVKKEISSNKNPFQV